MNLSVPPWAKLDGPSVASCAAALRLIPDNIPCLVRAQRLAAIGASMPAALDARPLSPSGLRALLKDPLVSGEEVRRQEDPYDQVYVEEVMFHGGPRLVLQGLTTHSAHTARLLLPAIFGPAGDGLPKQYVSYARLLTTAALKLSNSVCVRAGLRRGTMANQPPRRDFLVPGAARLAELRSAVTFVTEDLAALLSDGEMHVLQEWISEVGAHRVDFESSVTDDGLILRPLLRHGTTLIVANPGELASALRHHLIVVAARYGCRDELAEAFRRTAAALTWDLLTQIGTVPRGPVAQAGPFMLRRTFDGPSGITIDVGLLTDDLSGYDPTKPLGYWETPNAGQPLQGYPDPPGPRRQDGDRTLYLAVTDDLARMQVTAFGKPRQPGPLLAISLDELQVMTDLGTSDPLFLWRFAKANERFDETFSVYSWSVLDRYSIYRDRDFSFYLGDDCGPTSVSIAVGSGVGLRGEVQRRRDRHQILGPNRDEYIEVLSIYGTDTSPIYYAHPRHGLSALAVELPKATAWVFCDGELGEAVSRLMFPMLEALAYWIWQLALAWPGIVDDAAEPGRYLRVALVADDASRWEGILTGQAPEAPDASEDVSVPVIAASWIAASRESAGKLTVTMLAEHARVLLSGTNLADRQLVTALAQALIPSDDVGQADAIARQVAPPGPKQMIHVWLSSDVLLVPADVPARTIQPAVTSVLLDDLGLWLSGTGLATGPVTSSERTSLLNQVVDYHYQRMVKAVADLSPDGLMTFLVSQDEAILQDSATRAQRLPSQLACFGPNSIRAHDLRAKGTANIQAAVASRFLIEYAAATPPAGTTLINLRIYDDLLALAAELISRGTLSDAIHYGFSQVELSLLPSGRLGVTQGDRYVAGAEATAEAEAQAQRALALGPAPTPGASQLVTGAAQSAVDAATRARVDEAMRAEFGFTMTQAIEGLSDLAAESAARGRGPASEAAAHVRSRLRNLPGWDEETANAFLGELTLRPRAEFMSPGSDAYPWRYNRNLSYIRRPLIESTGPDGAAILMWSSRRTWFAARYWTDLIYTARLKGTAKTMKTLLGTIRQDQNKAFEHEVESILAQSGMPFTDTGVKLVCGKRLLSADGADLGDIDAIALDPANKTVIVAEAKDLELARTPAELANEAEELLTGPKSAVHKLGRRATWAQTHLALVLRHFGAETPGKGWRVVPVIVTSRRLMSPRVLDASIPVVARDDLPLWVRRQRSEQRRGRQNR